MVTRKRQVVQSMKGAITFVLILGTLSVIWPAIIALMMGAFLLLHSWIAGEEFVALSWLKVGNVSLVFASLRHQGFLTIRL